MTLGSAGMAHRVHSPVVGGVRVGGPRRGPAPGHGRRVAPTARRGRRRRKRKGRKNLFNLAVAILIAFLLLFTPAQEQVEGHLKQWIDQIWEEFGPAHEYPVQASYTLERRVILTSEGANEFDFTYELPIPVERTERGLLEESFTLESGTVLPAAALQQIIDMRVRPSGGLSHAVPLDLNAVRSVDQAINLDDGSTRIYWPVDGDDPEECRASNCMIWSGTVPAGSVRTLIIEYEILATSFSWWTDSGLPDNIPGQVGYGISVENSGSFADLERSGYLAVMHNQVGSEKRWADRLPQGTSSDWAIDGTDPRVTSLANDIMASLPATEQDNVFAFAHAAFVHVRDAIVYDVGLSTPRSGPACLSDGRGDCDEQSNAWMSLLRTREISTWYEFGALTDSTFSGWEAHAWSNVLLPLDADYCDDVGIDIGSCFITASVDVVNNKWLLHTPTGFVELIEPVSPLGEDVYRLYRPLTIMGTNYDWREQYDTIEGPLIVDGTYRVPLVAGQ